MASRRLTFLFALITFLITGCGAGSEGPPSAENRYEETVVLEVPRSLVGSNSEGTVPSFYYREDGGDVYLLDSPNHRVLHYGTEGVLRTYELPLFGCFRGLDLDRDRDQLVLLERPIDARKEASIYVLDLTTGKVERVREVPHNEECATVIEEATPSMRVYEPEDTIRLVPNGVLVTYLGPHQALLTDNELLPATPSCEPMSDGSGRVAIRKADGVRGVMKPVGECAEPNVIGDSGGAEYILFWDGKYPGGKGAYAIMPLGAVGENAYYVSESDESFCKGHLFVSRSGRLFRLRVSGDTLILGEIVVAAK